MRQLTFLSVCCLLLVGHIKAVAAPALTNGDFSAGLTSWTTQNSGDGDDTGVVWIVDNPGGSNQLTNNGVSSGPASRVVYQDFVVPASGVSTASFSFDYFANNGGALNSNSFTTFVNNPFGGNNGTRIDIISPADNVFSGPVLLNLFAPVDGAPVGTELAPLPNTFSDAAALASFLNARAGQTLRLRIGNREEDFPWSTGFDNLNLDIVALAPPPPPAPGPATAIPTLPAYGLA
ncbi:MAG: hypothetical protein V2I26_15095, partial [Halieaceae bacterium]|nr:hypothetical protein [Halieaceae bacterium]